MTTNGENPVDAEMAECDGEQIVTMMDVLKEQQDFEDDANAVLGGSDEKECTYSQGYIKRQAIYACVTCCPDAKDNPMKRAGFCLACSLTCHENHDVMELYTKRNFRCDCGNPKFAKPCQFTPIKLDLNEDNIYNQNFIGLYCSCHKPYGDLESSLDDEMIQCIICEDWWHASHLDAVVPSNDQYSEMICKLCMAKNEFLHDYSDLVINVENSDVDVVKVNGKEHSSVGVDEKLTNGDITDKLTNGVVESEDSATETKTELDSKEAPIEAMSTSDIENDANSNTEKIITEKPVGSGEDNANISSDAPMETTNRTDTITNPEKPEKDNEESEKSIESCEIDANKSPDALMDTVETDKAVEGSTDEVKPNTTVTDNESEQESEDFKEKKESYPSDDKQNDVAEEKSTGNVEQMLEESQKPKDDENSNQTDSEIIGTECISAVAETTTKDKPEESNMTEDQDKKDSNELADTDKEQNVQISHEGNESTQTSSAKNVSNVEETSQDIEMNDTSNDTKNDYSTVDREDDNTSKCAENYSPNKTNPSIENRVSEEVHTEENKVSEEASAENIVSAVTSTENPDSEVASTENLNSEVASTENLDSEVANTENTASEVASTENTASEMASADNTASEMASADNTVSEVASTENKRKLSTEDGIDDITTKKPKLDIKNNCVRPKGVPKMYKGATFWPCNFRQKLCTCSECITMYKDLSVLFLIDLEDTVFAYEKLGKERTAGKPNQYEKGMEALSSLGRVQQIDALTEYNKMRDKLLTFLQNFKDRKEIVTEHDIKSFFAGMKPKKRTDGVYFCG